MPVDPFAAAAERLADRIEKFLTIGDEEQGCEHLPDEDFLCWRCRREIYLREGAAALRSEYERRREWTVHESEVCPICKKRALAEATHSAPASPSEEPRADCKCGKDTYNPARWDACYNCRNAEPAQERPDRTPREEIEGWLLMRKSHGMRGIVRAALGFIDADHAERQASYYGCKCAWPGWPCGRKAEHERKLWEAIGVMK